MKKTLLLSGFISLAISATVQPIKANDGFNTINLTADTIGQLPGCLDYKIHGISFRLVLEPWPHIVKTLNVSHNAPELITQTHIDLDDMPWTEVNAVFGQAYKITSGTIFKTSMSVVSPETASAPISSGKYQYGQFGQHQAGQQYEASIFGNPIAFLMNGITWDGYSLTNVPTSNGASDADISDFFKDWVEGKITNISMNIFQMTGMRQAVNLMRSQNISLFLKEIVSKIKLVAERFNVRLGRSPMCPTQAQPIMPYYLSGVDSILWRTGYPIADIEHSLTVLNPLSDDRIGGTFTDPLLNISLPETWGHVYPRWGTVNLTDDAKASAVIAARGISILKDDPKSLGRIYMGPKFDVEGEVWAKVYPNKTQCHQKIENTSVIREQSKRYAWNNWMNHRCDLYRSGTRIAFFPLGPIQVTPKVPE